MYILYGGKFTRALMVQMVMAEGDIEYELREIDIFSQQEQSPQYLAINPAGFVPAMEIPGGEVLFETHAINLYLVDHHRLTQLAPMVDEPGRGAFLSGLFFICDDFEPTLKRYFYPHRYVLHEADAPEMRRQSLALALDRLKIIDQRMQQKGPYYLGERYSLVDLAACYWAQDLMFDNSLDSLPALRHCLSLVRKRPAIAGLFDLMVSLHDEYAQLEAAGKEPY
jgi:glutathione S-transferase